MKRSNLQVRVTFSCLAGAMAIFLAATAVLAQDVSSTEQTSGTQEESTQSESVLVDQAVDPPPPPPPVKEDFWTQRYMLGDWGGVRSQLKEDGVSFNLRLFMVPQMNFHGGRNVNSTYTTSNQMGYAIEFDMDKIAKLKGSTLFIRARQTWNDHNAGLTGDVGSKPYGGAGARSDREFFLNKFHWRQRFWDDRIEFRLGLLDAGDYFDTNDYADSVFGAFPNPNLEHNPQIPFELGLGAYLKVWPVDWLSFSMGAFDPDRIDTRNRHGTGGFDTPFDGPDRFTAIWQFTFLPHELPGSKILPGHYRVGWWLNPKSREVFMDDLGGRLAPRTRNDDIGFYVSANQMVWRERPEDPQDSQGLGLFARYGYAHDDLNEIEHFWSVGASYTGLIPSRDDDTMGFGVAQSIWSDQFRRAGNQNFDRETVYDLYYKIMVTPWLRVTPDLQYIANPGGDTGIKDAFVGGVRVEVQF